jgi:polyisoprenoid-binding protein YceI
MLPLFDMIVFSGPSGRRHSSDFQGLGYDGSVKGSMAVVLATLLAAAAPQVQPQAVHSIDVQHSKITVYVYKQGLFSFLADNHVIEAPIASGSFDPDRRTAQITVDASKMRVLDPHLAPDKRAQVQSNMLGPQVLDVQQYPTITFQSTSMAPGAGGVLDVTGNLQIHGQTHSTTFQAKESGSHFTGSVTVRQTAFGITPIKIAGGAVSVKDDVRIDFDILSPAAPPLQ